MNAAAERELDRAALLLLDGLTGMNESEICRGVTGDRRAANLRHAIKRMREHADGGTLNRSDVWRDRILLFTFRRLNSNVLIGPEDVGES